jgi:hypothetical protein
MGQNPNLRKNPPRVVQEWWWGSLSRNLLAEIREISPGAWTQEVEGKITAFVRKIRRVREVIDRLYNDVDRGRMTAEGFRRRIAQLQKKYRVRRQIWPRLIDVQKKYVPELWND